MIRVTGDDGFCSKLLLPKRLDAQFIVVCVSYMDVLLLSLHDAGVGCFIAEFFVGALAYADDIVLLAPTAHAMRRLLSTVMNMVPNIVCHSMQISQNV